MGGLVCVDDIVLMHEEEGDKYELGAPLNEIFREPALWQQVLKLSKAHSKWLIN